MTIRDVVCVCGRGKLGACIEPSHLSYISFRHPPHSNIESRHVPTPRGNSTHAITRPQSKAEARHSARLQETYYRKPQLFEFVSERHDTPSHLYIPISPAPSSSIWFFDLIPVA